MPQINGEDCMNCGRDIRDSQGHGCEGKYYCGFCIPLIAPKAFEHEDMSAWYISQGKYYASLCATKQSER